MKEKEIVVLFCIFLFLSVILCCWSRLIATLKIMESRMDTEQVTDLISIVFLLAAVTQLEHEYGIKDLDLDVQFRVFTPCLKNGTREQRSTVLQSFTLNKVDM